MSELGESGEKLGTVGGGRNMLIDDGGPHKADGEGGGIVVASAINVLGEVRREL